MVVATLTGCASTKAYFVDRDRDAADIFTATVGVGGGAKAQIGPLNLGLPFCASWGETGLRGGMLVSSPDDYFGDDGWLLFFGAEEFDLRSDLRGKSISFGTIGPEPPRTHGNPAKFTQIEVVVGLGGTIRLGFNPGELLDFILGWTTIDIYKDDLESRKRKEQSNNPPQATGKPTPDR